MEWRIGEDYMPKRARDYNYNSTYGYQKPYPQVVAPVKPQFRPNTNPQFRPIKPQRISRKRKSNSFAKFFANLFSRLFSLVIMILLATYVIPFGYYRISRPLFFGVPYKEVQVDYNDILHPTTNYLSNDLIFNTRLLTAPSAKHEMTALYATNKMPVIEAKLLKLMDQYKTIDPSIFVWDYDTGNYVDIKASEPYAAASIIKIPVLIQLFKSIEANQLTIYDEMTLTPYYRAEGSGDLQYKAEGSKYSIDDLARAMITKSDNSATNMLMAKMGSMNDVNNGIRAWGLGHTQVNNWLPDIDGTNYTTARDLATMLYNLDNPGFLNINSREYIIDYMSHVENNRLIQAGLDKSALFVHKTGDIGKMLGDAGIVYTQSGKKYIVVILANRPYNSPLGKDFIQKASKLIYTSMISGVY